jgi:hypothetical protein
MKTKLDKLLYSIDPARTLDQVSARVDKAINSFRVERHVIKQWGEFQYVLARFFCHLENFILHIRPPRALNPNMDGSRCHKLIVKEFGADGQRAAFEMVRTGAEGGLYAVLKKVGRRMVVEYAGNEISSKVRFFWNNLTLNERLSVPKEYLKKFGHLLPRELTEGGAIRIRANFIKVLEEHPYLIKRMRNVG